VSGKFIHPWAEKAVKTIQTELFFEKTSLSFDQDMLGMNDIDIDFCLEKLPASSKTNIASNWSFPNRIPLPQAIHALVHLLFLIGPADSLKKRSWPPLTIVGW
jgi:hypothetical protein